MIISQCMAVFKRLNLREQILLVAFVWVCVVGWTLNSITRGKRVSRALTQSTAVADAQEIWLNNETAIQTRLSEILEKLTPEKTYSSAALVGKIDTLARKVGLKYELSSPKTQSGETFDLHTLQVNVLQAPLDKLIEFDSIVKTFSPYITLDSLRISAAGNNPTVLEARFMITSFELRPKAVSDANVISTPSNP